MNTKPADEMTDDDLAEAVETLAAFARRFLPEGYVVRLECSQHADAIQLFWFDEPFSPGEFVDVDGTLSAFARKEGWGYACDAAHKDYAKRVQAAAERGEL